MTSDRALDDVIPALRRAGIEVNEFGLHLPSLDEVFHTLTGGGEKEKKTEALV